MRDGILGITLESNHKPGRAIWGEQTAWGSHFKVKGEKNHWASELKGPKFFLEDNPFFSREGLERTYGQHWD